MPQGAERRAAIDRALARAVVARFLARALAPADAAPAGSASPAELAALARAARLLEEGNGKPLSRAVEVLAAGSPPPGPRAPLFGHTLRGTVCPYESEYGRRDVLQQAHELADLAGFYRAFGLQPAARRRERPDHVACELEFLDFLCRKEAYALEVDDGEMLEATRQAIGKFLRQHLGRFGRAFATSLRTADRDGYYGAVADLCGSFLALAGEPFGVPLGPPLLELRPHREEAVPMGCGPSAELVQIGGAVGFAEEG